MSRFRTLLRTTVLTLVACASTVALATVVGAGQKEKLFSPEDLGLLEGPDRDSWQRPDQIMDALGIADGSKVADLGAGGGWFTLRLARRVGPRGLVYGQDVQGEMIEVMQRRFRREGLTNVRTILGEADDPKLPSSALDAVLIVDAYGEIKSPAPLLRRVASSLRPQGRIGIVDWKQDVGGPGPPREERVKPETVERDAAAAGLRVIARELSLPFQYLLVLTR